MSSPLSPPSSDTAIALNNRGVLCLQQDKAREAADLFRQALQSVQDEYCSHCAPTTRPQQQQQEVFIGDSLSSLQQEGQRDLPNHLPEDFSFSSFASTDENDDDEDDAMDLSHDLDEAESNEKSAPLPPISSVPVLADILGRQHECFDKAFLYLFDRALTIAPPPPTAGVTDDFDETRNIITSAIVMYNMALLHHSRGMSKGKSKYLSNATQLYQTSLHMIGRVVAAEGAGAGAEGGSDSADRDLTLLVLASLNNLAQISSHNCLNDEMNSYVGSMRTVLAEFSMLTGESGEVAPSEAMEQDEYAWFCINILFFESDCSAFAAAPAA